MYNSDRMLRFLTAGESHGRALVVILEGFPAGLPIDTDALNRELRRRQGGYGRGRRMAIESTAPTFSRASAPAKRSAVPSPCRSRTATGRTGSTPWPPARRRRPRRRRAPAAVTRPRPGHADLAGGAKYERADLRDVLERASARETAARVAAGALARQLLAHARIRIASHVFTIGGQTRPDRARSISAGRALADDDPLHCVDPEIQR